MGFRTARVVVSLLLALIILIPAGPTGGIAPGAGSPFIVIEEAPPLSQKIDPAVREAFLQDDYIEVLVKLTQQVDTEKVARAASKSAPPARQGRVAVRTAVVEQLRNNAAASQSAIRRTLEQEQRKGGVLEFESYYIVNLLYVKATPAVIDRLSRRPEVKVILPNAKIALEQPGAVVAGEAAPLQSPPWGISRINAPDAWNLGYDGAGVVVGVIDTGVAWQHDALKEQWRGFNPAAPGSPDPAYNWYDPVNGEPLPFDIDGHGTHVTGTVVGSAPGHPIGAAPGARWIAANVFHLDSEGDPAAYGNDIIAAAEYMLAPKDANGQNPRPDLAPDIVNNSWGGGAGFDEWFRPKVQAWVSAGILPVFAAGNSGPSPGTVSAVSGYPDSFAVAATNSANSLAGFSSRGPGPYPGVMKPDISAPGVSILSSVPGGYDYKQGTSMAAPHVAGAAALVLSANPNLTVEQLKQILRGTAAPLTSAAYPDSPNYGFGYGLVDALAAVHESLKGTVSGRVLVEGVDEEPPAVSHQQQLVSIYQAYNIPLEVNARDNVGVASVKAQVRPAGSSEWRDVSMYLYAGDHRNGDYWGQIPWDLVTCPGLEYRFVAEDFAGHQAQSPDYQVEVLFGLQPGWEEDFSGEPAFWGWDGDWQRGVPTVGPAPQHGGKLMATNLHGNYTANSTSFLWMPPLDLRGADDPVLRLDHWYQIDAEEDLGLIWIISDNGPEGEIVDIYGVAGDSEGWRTHYIDLAEHIGDGPVFVVFALDTWQGTPQPGWYIDRVSLMNYTREDLYFSDFEDNNGGFTVEEIEGFWDSWAWGVPSSGPANAYSGSKLWATNLSGNYPYFSGSILWSPEIDLGGRDNVFLEFWHWYLTEELQGMGLIDIYTPQDGVYWELGGVCYQGSKAYWSREMYDLTALILAGYTKIQIGFAFISTGGSLPGWYIDDVRVFSFEPGIQPAGSRLELKQVSPEDLALPREGGEDKATGELPEKYRGDVTVRGIDAHLPFRQPLQGPDPLTLPLDGPELHLLPVSAALFVEETELQAGNDPVDGTFSFFHPGSDGAGLTLRITAPGYAPEERTFTLDSMQNLDLGDIVLQWGEIYGDVDHNGRVDAADAILALRYVAGLEPLAPSQIQAANVNLDGTVDAADANLILRFVVGLEPSLPGG